MYTREELEATLTELIAKHGVPGAQLAVLDGDEIVEAAAGVLSLRTGSPVTADSLFLPGSIGSSGRPMMRNRSGGWSSK